MVTIREAHIEDLIPCAELQPVYTTRTAWQITREGTKLPGDQPSSAHPWLSFHIQQIRFPKTRVLHLPSSATPLKQVWNSYEGKLVAMVRDDDNTESAERPGGYLLLQILTDQQQTLIARLLIDQAARRQGIGTALIGAARAWAAKRGLTSLLAHVPLRNVPGVEFYQRCGFHVCGISEQFYPTREDALLLMRRV